MPEVRESVPGDVYPVAYSMRPEDVAELRDGVGSDPVAALSRGVQYSRFAFTIEHQGEPLALFGFGDHQTRKGWGSPWLLASVNLIDHWRWFARNTPKYVDADGGYYPVLHNLVDVRNEMHRNWLEWAGYEMGYIRKEHGVARIPFQEFKRVRNV